MCLAIPGRVIEKFNDRGLLMGRLDYAGTINRACLAYVPEVEIGQYVLVHAGFGITVIDEAEARKTYEIWDELVARAAEEGIDVFGQPLSRIADIVPDERDQ